MPEPDVASDLELLLVAARQAGAIALKHFRSDPDTWDKGDGAGPVTEADLEVDTYLRQALTSARPDYGWLSEETEDSADRLARSHVFIVDPIDGTRSFIDGSPTWAVSLAVVRDGQPTAAVVHLPARDLTYAAALGAGATKNGVSICASAISDPNTAQVLSAKVNFREDHWHRDPPPRPNLSYRSSLAYRLSLVAEGRFDAMLTLRRTWEWDVAAGTLIVTEAGGKVHTMEGVPPQFNSPSAALPGILAGAPALIARYAESGPKLP